MEENQSVPWTRRVSRGINVVLNSCVSNVEFNSSDAIVAVPLRKLQIHGIIPPPHPFQLPCCDALMQNVLCIATDYNVKQA